MAELESQPLSDEERAELEELRAEKARREAREEARREREELAALRAERAKAEEVASNAASERKPAHPSPLLRSLHLPRPNLSLKRPLVPSPSSPSRAVTR